MRIPQLCLVVFLVLVCASVAGAAVIVDTGGFESFATGNLNGQNGWDTSAAGTGVVPTVVAAPGYPAEGQQSVKLEVPDVQGDNSYMHIALGDLVVKYSSVTVSFDIYRTLNDQGKIQNLWWWWDDNGSPTYGLQWDQGNVTAPFGFEAGANMTPIAFGTWANITQTWDLKAGKAYSWYNGTQVDNGFPISGIVHLTGWGIQLGHDAATGTGGSVAFIDNFTITGTPVPEPGSLLALATGLIGFGGFAARKRR